MTDTEMINTFVEKAKLVSALVYPVNSLSAAFQKAVELCKAKPQLEPQMGTDSFYDPKIRIMAAPNLDEPDFQTLSNTCDAAEGIELIREDLRRYPWGIDLGVTIMDFGIAETGTLVLDSSAEETRLATMLSEFHVAILKTSDIRETALAMDQELKDLTRDSGAYTAFITGASRTADIERVLALGVHGPLELHIMLVED